MKSLSLSLSMSPAAVLAGMLMLPPGLQAAQLAYEGFDYPTGTGNLTNLAGGTGWNGSWLTVNNGSADVTTGSLSATGISPTGYDLRATGNSNVLPNNRRVGRWLDTSAAGPFGSRGYRDANGRIGADGKTIYLSFIQQPNGTSNYYEFEFHRGNLGDGGRIGGVGNDQSGDNVNLRAPNGTHTVIGAGSTAVNFYVVRIDFKAGNDDIYVYRNPTSATEPGTPTLVKLAQADMSFDGLSFGAFNNGRTVAHDEVRVGESWADVTVPAVSVPTFTAQPKATNTGYVGGTVLLSAEAFGYPAPTYQWFKGSTALTGQTGSTLTLTNVQTTDAGAYHVTATNAQGVATSTDAQVTIATAPAGLLAYEGFDYSTGSGNLPGKPGGIGWGAPWSNVNGGGGSLQTGSLAAASNAPNGYDAQATGNEAYMPNGQRDGRLLDTSATGRFGAAGYIDSAGNIGADGTTVYLSFLQQPDGLTKFYEFEFHRGNLGDPGRIGGIGNDTGNPTVALRTGATQTLIGSGSTGVNFYVVRIDFKAGNDDVYVYQNPVSATEPGTPTLVKLGASDMSFNGLSIAAFDNGRTVKHDEIRVGKAWSDVVFGTSRRDLVWKGDGTTNAWNFSAPNWTAGSAATTAFADGDPVTFDDSGSATPAIAIASNVASRAVVVNNPTKNYTISGPGTLNATGGLTKSGAGSLTLSGPSNFGSDISLSEGGLTLSGTTTTSGNLSATGGTATLSGTNTVGGIVTTSGNLTLSGPTTVSGAGAIVWMGNLPGADSTVTLQNGGSLSMTSSMADSWVIGRDGGNGAFIQNGGTVTYNPTNRAELYVGASIPTNTVASYTINGGTLEMSSKRLQIALGPITSHLNQTGGAINANRLTLGASLSAGPGTGIMTQSGGTLTIGSGGIDSTSNQYEVNLSGGTIAASADWSSILNLSLTGTNTTFDTGNFKMSLSGWLSGTSGVTKTGTGTLVLSGFNDYAGATTVSAGTIAGLGTGENSALTVASGASVAPGDPAFEGSGTFSTKTATLSAGSSLKIDVDSLYGGIDLLSATGAVNITGSTVSFAELSGGTQILGTNLIFVQGTSVTGTFAGRPEGSTVSVGANNYAIHYQPTRVILTVVAGSPYSTWAASQGLDATPGKDPAFDADPDKDGIINGLEWILGGNPLSQDATALYTLSGSATNGLTLNFNRVEASLGNATLSVQWSTDLVTWTDIPVTQAGNGTTVTVNQTPTPDAVTVKIPASSAVGGRLFARLKATTP